MRMLLTHVDVILQVLEVNAPSDKYFSNLSTLSNTLREYSARLREILISLFFDYPNIVQVASKLPPRCISGRWGQSTCFEAYIVMRPWAMISRAVTAVFGCEAAADAGEPAPAAPAGDGLDEDSLNSREQHRAKLGRWRSTTLRITENQRFRFAIELVHPVHVLYQQLQWHIMKLEDRPHGQFLEFLWHGNSAYTAKFKASPARCNWLPQLREAARLSIDASKVVGCILWHCASAFTSFSRRMSRPMRDFPFRAWQIVLSPPDVDCPIRRIVAQEVLDHDGHHLGHTLEKLLKDFREQFQAAADTGFMDSTLHDLMLSTGEKIRLHTQLVEGCNNYLLEIYKRAPWTTLRTMSHRLKVRRRILNGGSIKRWSLMKAGFESLRSMCLSILGRIKDIDIKDRWKTPPPDTLVSTKWKPSENPALKSWRATFCGAWFEHCKPDAFQTAFTLVNTETMRGFAYLTTCTHYKLLELVRAKLSNIDFALGSAKIELEPLDYYDHYRVVSRLYELCF